MADPNTPTLAKAELHQLKPDFSDVDDSSGAKELGVVVQFNPETLKVSYQNQIQQPDGPGSQKGSQSLLYVGSGTTKMSCTLWFDVNAPQTEQPVKGWSAVDDVRKLTNRVSYYIKPKQDDKDPKKFVPPAVRFLWGSFQFDGIMESVEESLEFFSPSGKPLRATVAIAMIQQRILIFPPQPVKGTPKKPVGTSPTTPVPQSSSVQQVAGANWQGMAAANGVENPRLPQLGLRLDLNIGNNS